MSVNIGIFCTNIGELLVQCINSVFSSSKHQWIRTVETKLLNILTIVIYTREHEFSVDKYLRWPWNMDF